jgi:2-phospho-L-lactate/phosphoenolpyruvate guanylyltransferase
MPTLVVPFRDAEGKSRLGPLPGKARAALARAMLEDVVGACTAVGATFVVAREGIHVAGAVLVPDPGGGQGAAVSAGLAAAALATGDTGPYLVVNADLPCVTARDLLALAGAVPEGGLALAPAADGTTNALGLASPDLFAPVYGPGSAVRFAALATSRIVAAPNLVDDVDTVADLERLRARLGPHTRALLDSRRRVGAAA